MVRSCHSFELHSFRSGLQLTEVLTVCFAAVTTFSVTQLSKVLYVSQAVTAFIVTQLSECLLTLFWFAAAFVAE